MWTAWPSANHRQWSIIHLNNIFLHLHNAANRPKIIHLITVQHALSGTYSLTTDSKFWQFWQFLHVYDRLLPYQTKKPPTINFRLADCSQPNRIFTVSNEENASAMTPDPPLMSKKTTRLQTNFKLDWWLWVPFSSLSVATT